jgi:RHS repeat-associated protein
VVTDTFVYDATGALTRIADKAGSATLQGFTYTHNADSLLSSVRPSGSTTQRYSYDAVNRLTKDAQGRYGYDPASDITKLLSTRPMAYNSGSELTSTGTKSSLTTYGYDPQGDRISQTPATGPAVNYGYDQADRLISFSNGTVSASYAYNGDGLRASKTGGSTTTSFTWDSAEGLPPLLADGTNSYLYGPGGLPIEQISTAGTATFFHHDQLGSTTMLTSVTGVKVATFSYASYGALRSRSGTVTTPLLYAGQYLDSESGLYYLRAREYDPSTGQFIKIDPSVTTTNEPYSYGADNPTNGVDPNGTWVVGSCVGGSAAPVVVKTSTESGEAVSGQVCTVNQTDSAFLAALAFACHVGPAAAGSYSWLFNLCTAYSSIALGSPEVRTFGDVGWGIPSAGFSAGYLISSAASIDELQNAKNCYSLGGSAGPGITSIGGDASWGCLGSSGDQFTTFEVSGGIGIGPPVEIHGSNNDLTWLWNFLTSVSNAAQPTALMCP